VGTSVLRIFAGLLASAAVSGAFICAVVVVKPGAGPAPTWPAAKTVPAKPLPMPEPAVQAQAFTPVLTPAPVVAVRVTPGASVRPRVEATTKTLAPKTTPATTPEAAAPSNTTPDTTPAPAPTAAPATPDAQPAPDLVQQVRTTAGETVSAATRSAAQAVAPVSPPVAGTVQHTGDTVAAVVSGG
jgi:hypothetical protein